MLSRITVLHTLTASQAYNTKAMRKGREKTPDRIREATSGYLVMVLSIICFVIAMTAVIAVVRLLGGVG